jgi:hypothetical protein
MQLLLISFGVFLLAMLGMGLGLLLGRGAFKAGCSGTQGECQTCRTVCRRPGRDGQGVSRN